MAFKLGSIFRSILGSGDGQASGPAVDYKGYTIRPASHREGSLGLRIGPFGAAS